MLQGLEVLKGVQAASGGLVGPLAPREAAHLLDGAPGH